MTRWFLAASVGLRSTRCLLAGALLLLGACTPDKEHTETSGASLRGMAPGTPAEGDAITAVADREPNDTVERAVELPLVQGRAVSTGILTMGAADVDIYRVLAPTPEGAVAHITLAPVGGGDVVLGVARGKGMLPVYFDGGMGGGTEAVPNAGLDPDGTYLFVLGRGTADVGYQIDVLVNDASASEVEPNDDLARAQVVRPGTSLAAFANRSGDRDVFLVGSDDPADAQQPFDLTIAPPGELPIDIRVETDQRQVWHQTVTDGKPLSYKGLRPQPGGYRVIVELLGETDRPRAYQLTVDRVATTGLVELEPNDEPEMAQSLVTSGEVLKGTLATTTDVDRFVVSARVPDGDTQILHVEVLPAPGLDVQMDARLVELGLQLSRNEGAGPEGLCNLRIDGNTTLELAVQAVAGSAWPTSGATYGLAVTSRPADSEELEPNDTPGTASELSLGLPVRGFVHPANDVDVYRFAIPMMGAGLPVKTTVSVERGYPANLALELKDAMSAGVGRSDVAGYSEAEALSADLPAGVYYVLVRSTSGSTCERPYTLAVTANLPAGVEPLEGGVAGDGGVTGDGATRDGGAALGVGADGTAGHGTGDVELPPEQLPVDGDEAPPATIDDF